MYSVYIYIGACTDHRNDVHIGMTELGRAGRGVTYCENIQDGFSFRE